jgi:hemerythrin
MAYIVWKDNFNIGVTEMDEQHKLFVSYINELYDVMQAGNSNEIVPILDKLIDYSRTHFAEEENLLTSINYPMLEIQKKHHAYYIVELESIKSAYLNKTQTAQNLLLFIKDWLLHHITTEDLKYAEFV